MMIKMLVAETESDKALGRIVKEIRGGDRGKIEEILDKEFVHLSPKSWGVIESHLKETEMNMSEFFIDCLLRNVVWKLNHTDLAKEEREQLIDQLIKLNLPPEIWYLVHQISKNDELRDLSLMKISRVGVKSLFPLVAA